MKNGLKCLFAVVALATMVGAYGQKPKAAAQKTMVCPSCKMKMGTVKTKGTPVAIKTKSGTFYCCAGCASGKAAIKAAATKKKK